MVLVLLVAGCSRRPEEAAAAGSNLGDQMKQGKAVYARTCALCHQDGKGTTIAPKLPGSAVLEQPPAVLAKLVLTGQSRVTVVDGKKFNGVMPPQAYLTNEELAALVVYVREAMAGRREEFTPEEVAKLR